MGANDGAGDGETEARGNGAVGIALARFVGAVEAVEDVGEGGGVDALACVAHLELDLVVNGRSAQHNFPLIRKTERVSNEIVQHLRHPFDIDLDLRQ